MKIFHSLLTAIGLFMAPALQAATLTVANINDTGVGSLRKAVLDALPGDTISFNNALSGQTILLGTEIPLDKDVTIDATLLPAGLTVSGNNVTRMFYVNYGVTASITGMTLINGNSVGAASSGDGGAIDNNGTLTLSRCTLSGNTCTAGGGAILNVFSSLFLNQCTLAGNTANAAGGAIYNFSGHITLTHCTASANSSNTDAGGIYTLTLNSTPTSVTLVNSIVSGNGAVNDIENHALTTFTRTGFNLVGSVGTTGTLSGTGTSSNAAPLLGPLASNGGSTKTMALLVGSPAINAAVGSSITSDQRGAAIFSVPDIGAFEYQNQAPFKLYDTGVDNAGNLLPYNTPDTHWTITNPANTVSVPSSGRLYSPWVAEVTTAGDSTGWVSPNATDLAAFPGFFPAPGHIRSYKTTFDLTGYEPTTAFIKLRWAMDDVTTGILLNGVMVPGSTVALLGFSGWNPITISSGFRAGINTLEFLVGNVDSGAGMIVDFTDYGAQPCGNWVAGRDLIANEKVPASEATNPNPTVPAWSYGYRASTALASTGLQLFTSAQHTNSAAGYAGLDGFYPSGSIPFVLVNTSAVPILQTGSGAPILPLNPGDITMHPGPAREYVIVRWTAPSAGVYSVKADWEDLDPNQPISDGASGHIVINGTVVYSQTWATGGPAVSKSIPSISLAAGDKVDFAVGAGADYYADSTRFNATITPASAPVAAPVGFALIPGGVFTMGDQSTTTPKDGYAEEVVHTVNVSAFYMGTSEVTRAQWNDTVSWTESDNGVNYGISATSTMPGPNYPVHSITWYQAMLWCNARSEQFGLQPCYTSGGAVVRTGTPANVVCDFTKNGYRLPTESEWEKAARGGIAGRRFAIGNTISHAQANYYASPATWPYDSNPTAGLHPSYTTTFAAPVCSFPPNPYGLCDMDGNVFEWCWDWKNAYPSSGALNPEGVFDSAYQERVIRSGSSNYDANLCRTAHRDSELPAQVKNYLGFRLAQTAAVLPPPNTPPCFTLAASTPAAPTGTTWTQTAASAADWGSVACSADGQKVIVAGRNGRIFLSTDRGLTWLVQTAPPSAAWRAVCSSSDGNTLAACASGGGIWRKSGGVWAQTSAPVAAWQGLACSYDGQRLVASVAGGGLYTSGNGGANWTLQSGVSTAGTWRGVACSASGQQILAAALTNVYESTDFGATWSSVATGSALSLVAMSGDGSIRYAAGSGEPLLTGVNGAGISSVLAGATTWSALTCNWDGKVYGATASPGDLDVRDAAGVIHHAVLNATWSGMACSADGLRFYASQSGAAGRIYTSFPGTAGPSATTCSPAQSIPNFVTDICPGPMCESWQTVTLAVTNNNNALFTVQPAISSSGTLTYTPGTTAGLATVSVVATDNGGTANGGWNQSITQTFTITILPDTAPTITAIPNVTINEDASTGALTFTIADVDPGSTLTVLNPTSSNTALVPSTGIVLGGTGGSRTITVTPLANQFGSTLITLSVSDGCLSNSMSFTVTVNPVNDAPTCVLGAAPTAPACSGPVTLAGFVSSISPGPANESTQTVALAITGNTNPGLFLAGGLPAVSSTGTLTFTPGLVAGSATITLTLTDSGGTANGGVNTTSVTFTITLTPDTAPTISSIANVTINEDSSTAALPFTVGDVDPGTTFTVSASSSNTALVANANLALAVISGTNGTSRTIQVTPLANQFGSTLITVSVFDGCLTTSRTFTVTVNPVNDAPSCTLATVPTVVGCSGAVTRTGFVTSVSPGPANESTQTVSFAITGNTNPGMFLTGGQPAISANGSTLTYAPGPGGGTATITLTKTDNGGTTNNGQNSATTTFTITVTPDTAPTISDIANVTIQQDTSTSVISYSVGDADPGTTLTVSATSSNTTLVPSGGILLSGSGGTRTIQVTPVVGQIGASTITVTVSDGCLTMSDTFVLTVTPCISGWRSMKLWNTGVSATGAVLPGGLVDPHYALNPGTNSHVVTSFDSFWMTTASSTLSRWIGPSWNGLGSEGYSDNSVPNYSYTTTVDLTGCDATTARIYGRLAADDTIDIYLNGILVPLGTFQGRYIWTNFSIASGFNPGVNTLEFRVHDTGFGATGLRVEMSGRIWCCCPADRQVVALPLWNTGLLENANFRSAGVPLAVGAIDPHYKLTTSANPSSPGPLTFATNLYGAPTTTSGWIAPNQSATSNGTTGNYTYTQQFSLAGYEANTATISGQWRADNGGSLYLNGTLVSTIATPNGHTAWTTFTIAPGVIFSSVINTLEFRVVDIGLYTGLRVEMTGTAMRCRPKRWTYSDWAGQFPDIRAARIIAEPNGDEDNDGTPNLIEYATGSDPITPSDHPVTMRWAQTPESSMGWTTVWEYTVADDADAIVAPLVTQDLQNWLEPKILDITPLPNGTTRYRAYLRWSPPGECHGAFLRLKVGTP